LVFTRMTRPSDSSCASYSSRCHFADGVEMGTTEGANAGATAYKAVFMMMELVTMWPVPSCDVAGTSTASAELSHNGH
jgi:hypothetical protein